MIEADEAEIEDEDGPPKRKKGKRVLEPLEAAKDGLPVEVKSKMAEIEEKYDDEEQAALRHFQDIT